MFKLATQQSMFGDYVAIFTFKMPFSTEDKVVIKHYRQEKHGVKRLLKEFPNKGWTKGGLRRLLHKIDKTGDFAWIPGSSKIPTALTNKNVEEVEELILSQEENPGTHESQRKYWKNYRYITKLCQQNMETIPWFNYFLQDQSSRFE